MPYCSVLSCRHQSKINNLSNGGISYHRFPHDPHLKKKWIDATGRHSWMPTKLSTICSQHFEPKCFIVKQSGYRYLSEKAVPTLNYVKFYVENQVENKEENSSDIDSYEEEPISERMDINVGVGTEQINNNSAAPNIGEIDNENAPSQNDTPLERRLKSMLQGKIELVRRQRLKIKQLQSKLRRLSNKFAIVEGELNQFKREGIQMGMRREKYVLKNAENETTQKQRGEFEFVRV